MALKKGETQLTPELLVKIKELSDTGLGSRKISKQLNISNNFVKRAYKQLNLDLSSKQFNKLITPEIIEQVKILYEKGLGCSKIAKEINFSTTTVSNIYQILGFDTSEPNRHRPRKLTTELLNQIIKLHQLQLDSIEIAQTLNVSPGLIRQTLKKLNLDSIHIQSRKQLQILLPKIEKLYHQGIGYKKIAKILNISTSRIKEAYEILGFRGIKRGKPRKAQFATEKKCIACCQIFPMSQFRHRPRKNNLICFESMCLNCERIYQNNKANERYANSPAYRLRNRVSYLIRRALFKSNSSKNGQSFLPYVPWTIEELKTHLENKFEYWMNWNNYGLFRATTWDDSGPTTWTWQIDHIIPQSDLPYTSMKDENFKICWSLENLRPYSAKQNNIDGVLRIRHNSNKSE